MENVILCMGEYAKKPYYIEEENLNLYSIEELCYYMFRDAWLLEDDFISDELLTWIGEELALPKLASILGKTRGKPDALCSFMEIISEETGLYSEEKIKLMRQVLKNHKDMSGLEKRKSRGDSYLRNGRYVMAADEYESLLRETDETENRLRAKLYHNLGVCAARQFLFDKAARFFKQAYDTYANTESYVQYLSALKLGMTDKEYLEYLAENPQSYEDSLEVESRINNTKISWKQCEDKKNLDDMMQLRTQEAAFYEQVDAWTQKCKDEYRMLVAHGNTK